MLGINLAGGVSLDLVPLPILALAGNQPDLPLARSLIRLAEALDEHVLGVARLDGIAIATTGGFEAGFDARDLAFGVNAGTDGEVKRLGGALLE